MSLRAHGHQTSAQIGDPLSTSTVHDSTFEQRWIANLLSPTINTCPLLYLLGILERRDREGNIGCRSCLNLPKPTDKGSNLVKTRSSAVYPITSAKLIQET